MFTLIDYIVNKYNGILNTKKLYDFRIDKKYIYINAFLIMALFISVFLLIGLLFDINHTISYLFYTVGISIISTYFLLKVMIEVKFQKRFKLDYKIKYLIIYELLFVIGIVSGVLSFIFVIIMPEIATVLDKILIPFIFTFIALFFYMTYLAGYREYISYFFQLIYFTILHSLLFLVLQFVVNIGNPLLWIFAYLIFIGIFYWIKDQVSYKIDRVKPTTKSILEWTTISIVLILSFNIIPIIEDINGLVSKKAVIQDEIVFPEVFEILDLRVTDEYYYVIDTTDDLKIYTKEFEYINHYPFDDSIIFITIQDELYLYNMNIVENTTYFYKFSGPLLEIINHFEGTAERSMDSQFPIMIDNEYYLVYFERFNYVLGMYTSTVTEVVLLEDPNITLDLSLTEDILYQDNDIFIARYNKDLPYSIRSSDWSTGNTTLRYANGMFFDFFKVDDSRLPSFYVEGFRPSNVYINDDLIVLSVDYYNADLVVYNIQGEILSSIDGNYMFENDYRKTFYLNQLFFWGNNNNGKILVLNIDELNHPAFQKLVLTKSFPDDELQRRALDNIDYFWTNDLLYVYFDLPLIMFVLLLKKKPKIDTSVNDYVKFKDLIK
jgi:hypothetical protein